MSDAATRLLALSAKGDKTAVDKLLPLVHDELRGLAASYFRHERQDHTLQPTALINEAYLRLVDYRQMAPKTKSHFFAMAAREVRRVLIDHARGKRAARRGGRFRRVPLDASVIEENREVDLVHTEELLTKLTELDPRTSKVVELRVFGGLTESEVAEAIGVSPRTVREDWRTGKAWLRCELEEGYDPGRDPEN